MCHTLPGRVVHPLVQCGLTPEYVRVNEVIGAMLDAQLLAVKCSSVVRQDVVDEDVPCSVYGDSVVAIVYDGVLLNCDLGRLGGRRTGIKRDALGRVALDYAIGDEISAPRGFIPVDSLI